MYCSKCSLRNPLIQGLIFWNAIFNDIQILCLGFLWSLQGKMTLSIREAIKIQCQAPTMNRDNGYELPVTYRDVLSCVFFFTNLDHVTKRQTPSLDKDTATEWKACGSECLKKVLSWQIQEWTYRVSCQRKKAESNVGTRGAYCLIYLKIRLGWPDA